MYDHLQWMVDCIATIQISDARTKSKWWLGRTKNKDSFKSNTEERKNYDKLRI